VSELRWRAGSGLRAIPVGIFVERVALEVASPPPSTTAFFCPYRSAHASYFSGVGTIDPSGHKRDIILSNYENNIGKGKELLCLFKPIRYMVGVDV